MKKLFFLLLIAVVLAGVVSAGSTANFIEAAGFNMELPGNIIDVCNVTPGTVSITVPLYAEKFIDVEKLIVMVRVGQNNFAVQEYMSSLKKDGALIHWSKPMWNQVLKTA